MSKRPADYPAANAAPIGKEDGVTTEAMTENGADAVDSMEILVLGAGQEVGRSCCVVDFRGKKVMFDCGIHPAYEGMSALPFFDSIDPAEAKAHPHPRSHTHTPTHSTHAHKKHLSFVMNTVTHTFTLLLACKLDLFFLSLPLIADRYVLLIAHFHLDFDIDLDLYLHCRSIFS